MDSRYRAHRQRGLSHKLRTDPNNDGSPSARRGTVEPPEPTEMPPEMPPEMVEMPIDLVDVLIYTNRSYWITLEDVAMAAETTKILWNLLVFCGDHEKSCPCWGMDASDDR